VEVERDPTPKEGEQRSTLSLFCCLQVVIMSGLVYSVDESEWCDKNRKCRSC
jgi:hypothetical protein